jgi:hypothetical protein
MNVMSGAMLGNDNTGWGNNWGNTLGGLNSFNLGMGAWPMMSGFASPFNSFGSSPWSTSSWSSGWGNPFGGAYPGGFSPPFGSSGYPGGFIPPFGGSRHAPGRSGYGPAYWNRGAVPYPSTALIEGRWFGNSGEVLEVRGNRFLLRSGRTALNGVISIDNNIISMYSPQTNTMTRYHFVRNQTGLLLQGMNGELLPFMSYPPDAAGRMF